MLETEQIFLSMQKYRLHTRRVPAAKSAPANQSVVVLGDLWTSPDQYDHSKANSSQSGSPQGPLQLAENGGDDEEDSDDDDAKSESYSWKGHIHKPGKDDVQSLSTINFADINYTWEGANEYKERNNTLYIRRGRMLRETKTSAIKFCRSSFPSLVS